MIHWTPVLQNQTIRHTEDVYSTTTRMAEPGFQAPATTNNESNATLSA